MGRYFASLGIAKELEMQLYNKPDSTWYVSIDDEVYPHSVVGFAAVFDKGKCFFIDNLYVLLPYRHNGIAKHLVREIIRNHTCKPIRCIANNPYALKIFHSLGFIEDGKNGKYQKLVKH